MAKPSFHGFLTFCPQGCGADFVPSRKLRFSIVLVPRTGTKVCSISRRIVSSGARGFAGPVRRFPRAWEGVARSLVPLHDVGAAHVAILPDLGFKHSEKRCITGPDHVEDFHPRAEQSLHSLGAEVLADHTAQRIIAAGLQPSARKERPLTGRWRTIRRWARHRARGLRRPPGNCPSSAGRR